MPNAISQDCTVYVVDDDLPLLRMLQTLIRTVCADVRAFASAREFMDAYRAGPCACLVCDLRMPDMDGLELQRRLKEIDPTLPIIFMTGFAEVSIAVEAMTHGALDFLEKPFGAAALIEKVRAGLAGDRRQRTAWRERQVRQARMSLLTPKERAVLEQVIDGQSSRKISAALGLSVRTVENHRARIRDKLHTESTVELLKLFL
ncbi:two-component system response regulator FixJ [Oxalobacteraceae bacterium GrIS 1.11]